MKGTSKARKPTKGAAQPTAPGYPYSPITFDEIEGLVNRLVLQDDDDAAAALVRLLHGMTAAHYIEQHAPRFDLGVEDIAIKAASVAYAKTKAFHDARAAFERRNGAREED